MQPKLHDDDLSTLLNILPEHINHRLREIDMFDVLIDIVLDQGRKPTARYLTGEIVLSDSEVSEESLAQAVAQVSNFDEDNRAGIERTLHRIAAIRNRRGEIVGLTCRVGRAVYGTLNILQDLIDAGKSVLLLGRPGVGKTTLLREAARVLAETRRVMIVDTSNEIGGDGDVPHPAVGLARRMQVHVPAQQHQVMIEAVENHTPEVIIIDEIGRELEAQAARTIAERGVQLIGTAHGNTLDNILLNPTLADLIGGIESVTLSDEEARRRGTQKTVLERRAPPTFDILIELQDRNRMIVHRDVADSVDALLRGYPNKPEVRYRDEDGKIHIEVAEGAGTKGKNGRRSRGRQQVTVPFRAEHRSDSHAVQSHQSRLLEPDDDESSLSSISVYAYGITKNRLEQAARRLRVPLSLAEKVKQADVLVTLKSHYRRHERPINDAEDLGLPIYVLRSNSTTQMENFLADLFELQRMNASDDERLAAALDEAHAAIRAVANGSRMVDLAPQLGYIRRQQHQLAREAKLISHSYGSEPNRRVRVFRE